MLDAMIAVGGLTRYAAGNDSVLVRTANGEQTTYSVHLGSLIRDGDVSSSATTTFAGATWLAAGNYRPEPAYLS